MIEIIPEALGTVAALAFLLLCFPLLLGIGDE